jgi:Flp pilus assembly CpaE family ATPase
MLELGLPREKICLVVNRCDAAQGLQKEGIEKVVGLPVAHTLSNDYHGVSAAARSGSLLKRDTPLGQEIQSLAQRIAGVSPRKPESRGWMKLLRL